MRSTVYGLLLLSVVLPSVANGQDLVPMGLEFQVNSITTGAQQDPAIAASPGTGSFLVVWEGTTSEGSDTDSFSIQARRLTAAGNRLGTDFQVNTYTTSQQRRPAVAGDGAGNFVVAWASNGSYGTDEDYSVQARQINSNGSPIGNQFQVNTFRFNSQSEADVAASDEGRFLVVWEGVGSLGSDTDDRTVQARLYNPDASPRGIQFQVNSYTTDLQFVPAVSSDPAGNFVVVWTSSGSFGNDSSSTSIQGQRFDANGIQIGLEFQVNSYVSGIQGSGDVASDPAGNFMVVWRGPEVEAQMFDSDGDKVGGQFQVNSYTTFYQGPATVGVDGSGRFVVSWQSNGSNGTDDLTNYSGFSIQARRFESDGSAVGEQFQVNTYTTNHQRDPSVAANVQGDFVVVWQSYGSFGTDSAFYSINGQRLGFPVSANGFDDGTFDGWTDVVPDPNP